MLEPLPPIREQIREQTGSVATSIFRRLVLWLIVFGGATLTWWQIDVLSSMTAELLAGEGWKDGGLLLVFGLAALGVVIAVGFSAITVMATDWFSAFICTILMFAPMAIFHQWEPLWIWWALGPLAFLILLNLLSIRSDVNGLLTWKPVRMIIGSTLWTFILISVVAPILTCMLMQDRGDALTPQDFRPLARQIVQRAEPEYVQYLLNELPTRTPIVRPMAARIETPTTTITTTPASSEPLVEFQTPGGGDGTKHFSAPKAVALDPKPTTDAGPRAITNDPTFAQPFAQPGAVTPAPATPPPPAWGQPTAPAPPTTLVIPVSPETPAVVTPRPEREPRAIVVDEATVDRLSIGLWHLISTQGDGYDPFPPLLPIASAMLVGVVMIPLTIIAVLVAWILIGFSLAVLRAMAFVNVVPVRVEATRYTLRGLRFRDEDLPPV